VKPVILTAHTRDELYTGLAKQLVTSCMGKGFDIVVHDLGPQCRWIEACNTKPALILHYMDLLKRPILWTDADSEMVGPLTPDLYEHDFAARFFNGPWGWYAGTILWGPNARDLLVQWVDRTKLLGKCDQEALNHLMFNYDVPVGLDVHRWECRVCKADFRSRYGPEEPRVFRHKNAFNEKKKQPNSGTETAWFSTSERGVVYAPLGTPRQWRSNPNITPGQHGSI
jgi:hypothetical protein